MRQLNDNVGDVLYAAAHMVMRGYATSGCEAVLAVRGCTFGAFVTAMKVTRVPRGCWIDIPEAGPYLQETGHSVGSTNTVARRFARVQWLLNLSAKYGGPGSKGIAE